MPEYRLSGLVVKAPMELPGTAPVPAGGASADVHIRQEPVPERLDAPAVQGPIWELDSRQFLLRLPEIGRILASSGSTLDLDPEPGVSAEEVLPFLLGTGWGAILNQRGYMTLRASAVAMHGSAIAICGASGAGKSTIAAALCAAGAEFVCDDIAAVSIDNSGNVLIWPDGRSLQLVPKSIEYLGLNERRTGEVRAGIDRHYVDPPGNRAVDGVRLTAIYMLSSFETAGECRIEALPTLSSAQKLLTNSYCKRLALQMARDSRLVRTTGVVLGRVSVVRLSRPAGLASLGEVVSRVSAHWRALPSRRSP